jgi:hypothetical protein
MLELKPPEGVEDFENVITEVYSDLIGYTTNGLRVEPTMTRRDARIWAQFVYTDFIKRHDNLITDLLSHESVTILYDLGVELNQDDPLRQKKWFMLPHSNEGEPPTILKNPYCEIVKYSQVRELKFFKAWSCPTTMPDSKQGEANKKEWDARLEMVGGA